MRQRIPRNVTTDSKTTKITLLISKYFAIKGKDAYKNFSASEILDTTITSNVEKAQFAKDIFFTQKLNNVGNKQINYLMNKYSIWRGCGNMQQAEIIGFQWAFWELIKPQRAFLDHILHLIRFIGLPYFTGNKSSGAQNPNSLFNFRSIMHLENSWEDIGLITGEDDDLYRFNKTNIKRANISMFRGTIAQNYLENGLNGLIFFVLSDISLQNLDLNRVADAFNINIKYYYLGADGNIYKRKGLPNTNLFPFAIRLLNLAGECFLMYEPKCSKIYLTSLWKILYLNIPEKKEVKKINIYDEEENNRCKDCYRIFSEFPNAKIAFERCLQTCIRESCDICNYIAILVSETYAMCFNCQSPLTYPDIQRLNNFKFPIMILDDKIAPFCRFCDKVEGTAGALISLHSIEKPKGIQNQHLACDKCIIELLEQLTTENKSLKEAICPQCSLPILYEVLTKSNFKLTQLLAERHALQITLAKNKWNLSRNITMIIMSYISPDMLFMRAIRVSKQWREAILHPFFIEKLVKQYIRILDDREAEEKFYEDIFQEKYKEGNRKFSYSNSFNVLSILWPFVHPSKINTNLIPILGYRTDGGAQGNICKYDMRDIFGLDIKEGYQKQLVCSHRGTKNINISGVLINYPNSIEGYSATDEKLITIYPVTENYLRQTNDNFISLPSDNKDEKGKYLILIDISKYLRDSLEQLFVIKKVIFSTAAAGSFSCPLKTFAIFTHNQPISYLEEILEEMDNVTTLELMNEYIRKMRAKNLVPPVFRTNYQPSGEKYILFDQKFYEEESKRVQKGELNLRLQAWVQMKGQGSMIFEQNVIGRFVTLKLIDYHGTSTDANIDLNFIKFYGKVIPSLIA